MSILCHQVSSHLNKRSVYVFETEVGKMSVFQRINEKTVILTLV